MHRVPTVEPFELMRCRPAVGKGNLDEDPGHEAELAGGSGVDRLNGQRLLEELCSGRSPRGSSLTSFHLRPVAGAGETKTTRFPSALYPHQPSPNQPYKCRILGGQVVDFGWFKWAGVGWSGPGGQT